MVLTRKYYNVTKVSWLTNTFQRKENLNLKSLCMQVFFRFNNWELYNSKIILILFWMVDKSSVTSTGNIQVCHI